MWSFINIHVGVKGKQLCARNHFQYSLHCDLDRWPFDPKVHRVHIWLMGRLHVKFHEDRCKGEAVMRLKPFYLTAQSLHCDLDLWPFDPKVHRAHTWLMGRLHVKFHEDRCKGEAFMRLKPFYLTARLQTDGRTDRQTDGQGDSSIPPLTSLRGGGGGGGGIKTRVIQKFELSE